MAIAVLLGSILNIFLSIADRKRRDMSEEDNRALFAGTSEEEQQRLADFDPYCKLHVIGECHGGIIF